MNSRAGEAARLPGIEATANPGPSPAQKTLAQSFSCQGVGLHSGATVTVRVNPGAIDTGRYFVRTDLAVPVSIPAQVEAVHQTQLSTELGHTASVRTVEHLLAALWGLGVDNACIEIDGPELPLLDGSAQDWVNAIATAGLIAQPGLRRPPLGLTQTVSVQADDAFVVALPAPELRFTYGIDFNLAAIGNQWHSWSPAAGPSFAAAIAPARTFGLAHQIEYLRSQGLIQGGSLDNALVCGPDGWLNPPLRFANEPVRHKLLDLVGDLSLLGQLPTMHVMAYKASHQLHVQLAKALRELFPL